MKHNTTLEFLLTMEKNPGKEEEMLFRPRKIGKRLSKVSFTVVKKGEPTVVLATIIRSSEKVDITIKQPDLFTRADAQNALQAIGTAMATELSRLREISTRETAFSSEH